MDWKQRLQRALEDYVLPTVEVAFITVVPLASFGIVAVLLIAPPSSRWRISVEGTVETLGDNWPLVLIALLPVFYKPIRTFLEEVQEFGGMKRPVTASEPEALPNPPKTERDADKEA